MTVVRFFRCLIVVGMMVGCTGTPPAAHVADAYKGRVVYSCCNLYFESGSRWISDGNHYLDRRISAGAPLHVSPGNRGSRVNFVFEGETFTLAHEYGTRVEGSDAYFGKIFQFVDPKARLQSLTPQVRDAIVNSKVIPGMTPAEVLLSLGYPPANMTPTLEMKIWTYYFGYDERFQVVFTEEGRVRGISALESIRVRILSKP